MSGALTSTGTAVPHVCPLVRSLGGRAQTEFFLPESSAPGTEEIVCVAKRPNIFQNVPRFLPCPLSLSMSQALQQPERDRDRGQGTWTKPSTCPVSAGARAQRKELACDFVCPVALLQRKPLPRCLGPGTSPWTLEEIMSLSLLR